MNVMPEHELSEIVMATALTLPQCKTLYAILGNIEAIQRAGKDRDEGTPYLEIVDKAQYGFYFEDENTGCPALVIRNGVAYSLGTITRTHFFNGKPSMYEVTP